MSAIVSTFGIDWHELVLQSINFAILIVLLWYFLYRPILRIIDARREKVAEGVRIADEAQHKLEDAHAQSDVIVSDAAREAEGLVAAARTRASEAGSEIVKGAEDKAAALLRDAQALAEESKRQALLESEREIAKAAVLAAEKILREKSA